MRALDLLSPLGLIVMLGAWLGERLGKPLPGSLTVYLVLGGALLLAHLLLRWEDVLRTVGARQLRYGGNALVFVLLVAGILGALNYLAQRRSKRWDLTKNQRYSLSDQSRKVLDGLKQDIRVSYFQRSADMPAGQDRMKQYQAASSRIKLEFVDPLKDPVRAREDDISLVPTLVVAAGDKKEKISNDSEQDVTNAIVKVTRSGKKTICFATGEGERDPDDSSDKGLSASKSQLEKNAYATRKVALLGEKDVPAECTVVVMAGPQKDPAPPVMDQLRRYVKGGGKTLVLVDPELKEPTPNLVGLLKEWNLEAGRNVVVDLYGAAAGLNQLATLGRRYPYHEITKDFAYGSVFFMARTMEAGKATVAGVTAQNLVETTPEAQDLRGTVLTWAATDTDLKKLADPRFDAAKDRKGPLPLAAVATIREAVAEPSPSPSPAAKDATPVPPKPEGRVVAVGDSDFASNALVGMPGAGNLDLLMNALAWLAEDADLISIRPREADDQRMMLTRNQQLAVLVLSLLVLPGLFVVLGVASWWRRR